MKSPICEMLGVDFPLLAFSHCRDVVAAVSKAGGMGVFGAVNLPPDRLREELDWIDANCGGKPYGLDLIVPQTMEGREDNLSATSLRDRIPAAHMQFADDVLRAHDIEPASEPPRGAGFVRNMQAEGAAATLEVAFDYPIALIANALGVPPPVMLEAGKAKGVPVAALVGAKEHALAQVQAGVDILVVAGGEAGGHCGDVPTMVLVPEVRRALERIGAKTPILAAGGIVTGAQMAAAMAMGADGAWCGSVWLTTSEAETSEVVKEKMLAATSRDTIRSRSRTGKPSRQLRSPWTDAWEREDAPKPLPMPLQSLVSEPALRRVSQLAETGHAGARELATYWVGQGVGLMDQRMSCAQVVQDFREDFLAAYERLGRFIGE